MSEFTPSAPDKEQVALTLVDSGLEIRDFTEYSFNSNFLTPTDGWSFTIGDGSPSSEMRQELVPGKAVKLTVNGGIQSSGYIDSVEVSASRGSGTIYRIEGRDRLARAVDSGIDTRFNVKDGQTLEDALVGIFGPFGWTKPDNFIVSNDADRGVKTSGRGPKRGTVSGKELKRYKLKQFRPYPKEGAYEFAARITQRFGLWIWATASGEMLVVSKPNFELDPFYELYRKSDGTTNVLEGTVKKDITDQPTVILAQSINRGGEYGANSSFAYANNPSVTPKGGYVKVTDKYPSARKVDLPVQSGAIDVAYNSVMYLIDDEAQTQEALENFVKREMALLQRKSLSVHYTVEGHGQITPDGFVPWTVDTVVRVEDELAGINENLYVLGRTFNKSRSGGTTTQLELIGLNTLSF